ncbi:lysosomal-associated transmembrane protein 4B-like [Teleopsis dalmanni]|uniref:lysosomal-associated transmembrane protein 4B-like n=1 Tax=Teleopsis dalmanni TaxID=139649 RepID=UPI0018CC99F9|nr:lysosomal-associated transmembrane protein 4B-like [Teleopsis dalmanni]XP_037952676.1 lysosomal-associated transmembrane protein 4B-like [Teleopsis dalmanni]
MMEELENSYDYNVDPNAPILPTPLSKIEPPYAYRDHSLIYRKQYQNFDMGGLVCTCMIAITLMMIYGTIKGKPSHLLPFFCLQLFDFAITTLTAAGYLCYLQAIHRLVAESPRLPWREKLLELSPEELVIVVLVVFICIVFLKAYAIGIVWRCYKYLTLRQQNMRTLLPCVMPDIASANLVAEERAYSTLLPNYDEAIAQYMKQAPPPSYQVAMSNYEAEENTNTNDAEGTDNNNDTPNNNNTVHVNANTPPMRRNENTAAAVAADADADITTPDTDDSLSTPPPAYNDTVTVTNVDEQESPIRTATSSAAVSSITEANSIAQNAAHTNESQA